MIIPGGGALWQQKVPLYYEDDSLCPSSYIIYLLVRVNIKSRFPFKLKVESSIKRLKTLKLNELCNRQLQ